MMKKVSSVRANNEKKEKVVAELKSAIFQLEKGKFHPDLDRGSVMALVASLKEEAIALENTVGTGEEQVDALSESALVQIKELRKKSGQTYLNRFESCVDDLVYTLTCWKSLLDGRSSYDASEEAMKADKITWVRKKLNSRLEELEGLKEVFVGHEKRLEEEILASEKDLAELDDAIVDEDNERKINDLFRKISALKSKIDMMNVRKNNYSACYNLLDMIASNASEIVEASDVAGEEFGKAKALLNMGKLRSVLSEPDKAMAILRRMQADVSQIAENTKAMDKKIFSLDTHVTSVSADAQKYKEDLMNRRREKAVAQIDAAKLEMAEDKTEVETEGGR